MQGKKYFPNRVPPEHEKRRPLRALDDVVWPCSLVEPQKAREKPSLVMFGCSDYKKLSWLEQVEPVIKSKTSTSSAVNFKEIADLDELDMVT